MYPMPINNASAIRTPDSADRIPVAARQCVSCEREIYVGDEITEYCDRVYCDDQCLTDDLLKSGEARPMLLQCSYHKCQHRFSFEEGEKPVLYDGMLFCDPDWNDCLVQYLRQKGEVTTGYAEEEARHGG